LTHGCAQVILPEPVTFVKVNVGTGGAPLIFTVALAIQPNGSEAVTVKGPVPIV